MAREEKKILLFGFETLPEILRLRDVASTFWAELLPIGRSDYGKTLAVLAGLEEEGESAEPGMIPGRMAVLCGLDGELDGLLPAMQRAGAGESCLKAVLTRHNRNWSAPHLYEELSREREAIRRGQNRT